MQGETILCVAPRVWHSLWRDTQPVMWRVAEQNQVLYFEPGRSPDRPHADEMRRNWPNYVALRAKPVRENLIAIATPSNLPVMRQHLPQSVLQVTTPWVTRINAWILIRHIRWAMSRLNVQQPILWLYSPYHADLVGKFGEKLSCYYNYDEFPEFSLNARVRELLRRYDDRLCRQADVVFATSRAQWKRRQAVNPNTYFSPNGVDFDVFNRALVPNQPLPSDVADVPRPIIGFVGWLGYQVDSELLIRVADAYPDCSLVLVGPDELPNAAHREQLRARSNVIFLGEKDRDELADYLQVFDVALIPYVLTGHVLSIYPLKLHEYLAAGRATVATAIPALQAYADVVRIATTHEEFICHISLALRDDGAQAIEARTAVARENTWDQRVADVYRVLDRHLAAENKEMAL